MLRYELPIWRIRSYMCFAGLGIYGLVQRAGFDHLRWSKTQSSPCWARLHHSYGKTQYTPDLHKWFCVKTFTWSCQDLSVLSKWQVDVLMYQWCLSSVQPPCCSMIIGVSTTQIYPMYWAWSQSILGDCLAAFLSLLVMTRAVAGNFDVLMRSKRVPEAANYLI